MTPAAIDLLRHEGIVRLGQLITPEQVAEIRAFLAGRLVYPGHVTPLKDRILRTVEDTQKLGAACACYPMAALVQCPHILELAQGIEPMATEYLGQEPVMYSINAWWSFPTGPLKADTQDWHRDADDTKFVALFLYLTDMDEHTGHRFIRGSHANSATKADEAFAEHVAGPAGTCVITDARGFHMGGKPSKESRLICWIRFGVSDPPAAYSWDAMSAVDNKRRAAILDERQKRIFRLVVQQ